MSGLRGRSAVAADHRSALPQIPGIPWWGAALVAVAATAVGFAYDAGTGSQALGGVFAACYVIGCVLAVLAVRQSGVFTAVIQPPLILFVAVPAAYFAFHGSTITGIKDILINCGYPLIERFPLMFSASAAVLVIGMVRWYLGAAARRAVPTPEPLVDATPDDEPARAPSRRSRRGTTERPGRTATAETEATVATDDAPSPRRSARTAASVAQKSPGAAAETRSRRSRHAIPPEADPIPDRRRRRGTPPIEPPGEPRRRPRTADPRERRPLPPLDRRGAYERPERAERPQRRDRAEPVERPGWADRPQRRSRVSNDYEPYEPPPSRPNGNGGTHHPVSRVRYRSDAEDGESRTEHRTRPRPSRHSAPDSWEYDV